MEYLDCIASTTPLSARILSSFANPFNEPIAPGPPCTTTTLYGSLPYSRNLVDITEPICQDIEGNLASMLLFDTSGIEAYVTENNPKCANRIIKQLKSYAKAHNFDDSYEPYKVAYASMPTSATANHEVK